MALGARPPGRRAARRARGHAPGPDRSGVGLAAALALGRALASLVFGIRATDPLTFAAVTALLGLVALAACALPAWRASRVEPTAALQEG